MTPHNVLVCRLFRSLSTDSVACGKFFAGIVWFGALTALTFFRIQTLVSV